MRKQTRKFGWIILGLSMVGLVGFGSANFGGSVRAIGTVGDTEIDANRYFRELRGELDAYQAQIGQPLPMAQAQAFGIDRQVLGRVIAMTALENETRRLGISVGDEEVRRQLVSIQDFQGIDGRFDRETYEFVMDQSGLTAGEFEASLRSDAARSILQAAVSGGTNAADTYVDTIFNYVRETRNFTWAAVEDTGLETEPGVPGEDQLTTYYEANPADFTLPEIKKISYAWLSPDSLAGSSEVDEAELRALYDERIDEYVTPERRIVERLVFATMQDAQAAADSLAAAETTFEELVQARGLALEDVDLGDVAEAELGDAGAAVFALTGPGIAGPATSDLGPAIFRMNAVLTAQETPFEAAREALVAEYTADAARRQIGDMVVEFDDLLAGGATLEELADAHGLTLDRIDWFEGSNQGIAAYDSFREVVQTVTTGDYPEITLMADGGVFALRLDGVEEPRLQALDEVREAVIAGWTAQERIRLLTLQGESYLPRFATGESPSSLGLTEVMEIGQGRDGFIPGTPPDFMTRVFEMTPGEWQIVENGADLVLVRLDTVTPADHNSDEAVALKQGFAARTAQEIGLDAEIAFAAALQNQAGITLNQPVISAINGQFP